MQSTTLTYENRRLLLNSIEDFSEYFSVRGNIDFLSTYLTPREIENCLNAGDKNVAHVTELIITIIFTKNNSLFLALLNHVKTIYFVTKKILQEGVMDPNNVPRESMEQSTSLVNRTNTSLQLNSSIINLPSRNPSILSERNSNIKRDFNVSFLEPKHVVKRQRVSQPPVNNLNSSIHNATVYETKEVYFLLPPTPRMISAQDNFESHGLRAVMCDEYGTYPPVDFATLNGPTTDWAAVWKQMKRQSNHTKSSLWLPPMILPTELGGWLMFLWIDCEVELILRGYLTNATPYNNNCPSSIEFHLNIHCNFGMKRRIATCESNVIVHHLDHYQSDGWNLLYISDRFDKNWSVPVVSLSIAPPVAAATSE